MNRRKRRLNTTALIILTVIVGLILIYLIMNVATGPTAPEAEPSVGSGANSATEQLDPRSSAIQGVKANMDDYAKAGQLFLARVPEEDQVGAIQEYGLGGYLIFGRDVEGETPENLALKIEGWQASSAVPMFIASDEEGGTVTRVSEILPEPFPSPGELYANGGMEAVLADATSKSITLKELGINLNLAPVADVAVNPQSFIYDRTLMLPEETTLEEAADITAEYVRGVVEAMRAENMGCSLKHFPGYGENADSHTDIIHDTRALEELEMIDFIPFEAGIQAGAGGVMISHNIAEAIDPSQPASISPAVHEVLRNQLGFTGVIISDDFDMAGLADFVDQDTGAIQTINAGTDLIISSSYPTQIEAVVEALNNGGIPRDRFEEAVDHVLGWKYDLGLLSGEAAAQ